MLTKEATIRRRPLQDTPSGWVSQDVFTRLGRPLGEAPGQVDWIVVGAGFTGLAAARRVAELQPSDRVALIDARPVGWGASGRNSGFVIDLPHKFDLDSRDPARLSAILRLNRQAIADLETAVERHRIDCEWSRAGKLQGAVKTRGTGKMAQFIAALEAIGEPYRVLLRDELAAVTGTPHYAAAVHTPGSVLMNPVKLTRGLAASLPPNVALLDDACVTSFAREPQGFRIELGNGDTRILMRAPRVLLCVNAFTPEFSFMRNRVVPVMTFASITAPLTPEQLARYAGRLDWGLTPADAGGTTLRMTQDGRLLVRNQYDYAERYGADQAALARVRTHHRAAFAARWPDLANVPFASTWGGVCGLSRNHVACFGELAPGVWGSFCHNGVGVARGTISGRLLAEAATGRKSDLLADMYATSNTPALNPPNPLLALGVRTRLKIEAWKSREEV